MGDLPCFVLTALAPGEACADGGGWLLTPQHGQISAFSNCNGFPQFVLILTKFIALCDMIIIIIGHVGASIVTDLKTDCCPA